MTWNIQVRSGQEKSQHDHSVPQFGQLCSAPAFRANAFEWSVPVGQMKRGRNNHRVSVEAYETCCEYLYVHESIEIPGFSVSHKLTGYALAQGVPTLRAAPICRRSTQAFISALVR